MQAKSKCANGSTNVDCNYIGVPRHEVTRPRESRPEEFHRPAPRRTERETLASLRSHQVITPFVTERSVCCTHGSSCRQLPQECNDLTRSLCSSPITEPSSLLRIGPPQCFASVLSPHGFRHLCFSLGIEATGSCSSAKKPAPDSRPLHAGRCRPTLCWNSRDVVSGFMSLSDQAATSRGRSMKADFAASVCHPSTLRMMI